MRTVIVALQTHPKLMGAILGILTNMINKQVGISACCKPFHVCSLLARCQGAGESRVLCFCFFTKVQ